jgi:hypothetical protein
MTNYTIPTPGTAIGGYVNYQYYPYPQIVYQPYPVTLEAPMSKTETAIKVVSKLIEEGLIDGDKLKVKDFLSLVTKLVEDVL